MDLGKKIPLRFIKSGDSIIEEPMLHIMLSMPSRDTSRINVFMAGIITNLE